MTPEEYAEAVLGLLRRVAVGVDAEAAATVEAAKEIGPVIETVEALARQAEHLGYVRGLTFAQELIGAEAHHLLAQMTYDAQAAQ